MRECQTMIEKIEILARTVGKVRLQDHEPAARAKHPVHFGETAQHVLSRQEMLIDVACKHRIQGVIGKRPKIISRICNDLDVRCCVFFEILFVHVQRVFRSGMYRIDKVTVTGSEVQDRSFCGEVRFQISADRYPISALLLKFLIRKTIAIDLFFHRTERQV
jgi:hypothetical protein